MHRCESCPGTATPKELFIKHSTNMKMMRNLITVSGTLRIEQFCQPLQPLTNDDLTWHSYIDNLKTTSSWFMRKPKAVTGVKNTESCIPWKYTACDQIVASNGIQCFISDDNNQYILFFCFMFKQCYLIILKLITHLEKKLIYLIYLFDGCRG